MAAGILGLLGITEYSAVRKLKRDALTIDKYDFDAIHKAEAKRERKGAKRLAHWTGVRK